jgi:hypothetical protein
MQKYVGTLYRQNGYNIEKDCLNPAGKMEEMPPLQESVYNISMLMEDA